MNIYMQPSQEQHIRNKIHIISFICSMLVIWIHTYNLEVYGISEQSEGLAAIIWAIEEYWSKITKLAVPAFFMISGFLFFRTFSLDKISIKYKNRIKSILIPYLIWSTIYYFYYVFLSVIPFIRDALPDDDIVSLSFGEWLDSLWIDSYYTLWFLKYIIIFIAVSPCIYCLLKHWNGLPIGAFVIIFLFLNIQYKWLNVPDGVQWYFFGSWVGINFGNIAMCRNKLLSWLSIFYICFTLVTGFHVWNEGFQLLFYIAIWFALDSICCLGNREVPDWMKITFFTYVAHDIFLEAFEKIYLIIWGYSPIWALIDYIFMPVLVFVLLVFLAAVMKRYMYPMWKVLSGNR